MFIGLVIPHLWYLLAEVYTEQIIDAAYESYAEDILDFAGAWCGV